MKKEYGMDLEPLLRAILDRVNAVANGEMTADEAASLPFTLGADASDGEDTK